MQDVHPKAKKKKRQRKKSTINMREAKKFFADQEQRLKQKEPEQRLTKSERHVNDMKLAALRTYLTSTMEGMNRETLLEAMRVFIAGMNTNVGRECASVSLAYFAAPVEENVEEELDEAEEEEMEEEKVEEAKVEEMDPHWVKSLFSISGYKGVTRDRGRWKCTVRGRTIARCDTKAEACDAYLEAWKRAIVKKKV